MLVAFVVACLCDVVVVVDDDDDGIPDDANLLFHNLIISFSMAFCSDFVRAAKPVGSK